MPPEPPEDRDQGAGAWGPIDYRYIWREFDLRDDPLHQDGRPWVESQPPPFVPRIDPRITEDYQSLLEQLRRSLELQPPQIVIPADQVEFIKGAPESAPRSTTEPGDGDRVRRLIRKRNRSEGDGLSRSTPTARTAATAGLTLSLTASSPMTSWT